MSRLLRTCLRKRGISLGRRVWHNSRIVKLPKAIRRWLLRNRKPRPWYKEWRIVEPLIAFGFLILLDVVHSPVARIWFGALIIGSLLVALFLHLSEKDSLP